MVVVVGVVMAAMLALSAGPAMADEWDDEWGDWNGHHGFDEVLWLDQGTAAYDQWCSPGLPEGIYIPGCIFSDVEEDKEEVVFIEVEEDDFFDDFDDEEVVFLLEEDDFFDHDDDKDGNHDGDRKRRNHHG